MLRHFPNGRTARPRIAVITALSASLLAVTLTTPAPSVASTDDHHALTHQKVLLGHALHGSRSVLADVSRQLVTAQGRLDSAVGDLSIARANQEQLQSQVEGAVAREQQLQQELDAALARLANARRDLVQGRSTVARQRSGLAAFAVSNATSQVTQLSTLGLVVTARSTHAAIGEVQGANSALDRQLTDLQRLQANQALLRYTEHRVRQAAADVAADRDAAAADLARTQVLEAGAAAAAGAVQAQVSQLQVSRSRLASAKTAELARIQTMERERSRVEARLRQIAERRAAERRAAAHRAALAAQAAAARAAAVQAAAARTAAARKAQAARAADGPTPLGTATPAPAPSVPPAALAWPVSNTYITSPYGMRMHPILHIWELHDGLDLHALCGAPVYAAADGRVTSEYYNSAFGNRLTIDHGFVNGVSLWTSYNHLQSFVAPSGTQVSRGQLIAYSGDTGFSTGCHLHFMVYANGNTVDPLGWL